MHTQAGKHLRQTKQGPAPTFAKDHILGALIQAAAFVSLALQSFLAPRLLGPVDYGVAAFVLTVPYLFQAAIEPIVMPLTIRWQSSPDTEAAGRLYALRRDSATWTVGAVLLTFAITAARGDWSADIRGTLGLSLAAALFVALTFATTHLLAVAYAMRRYGAVAAAYPVASVVFVTLLALLKRVGPAGMAIALCASQAATSLLLWRELAPRVPARGRVPQLRPEVLRNSWSQSYFPMLSPRLAQLALNPGSVLMAGLLMTPSDVAAYKVTLSLVAAGAYLVPVSPSVLQKSVQDGILNARKSASWGGLVVLGGIIAVAVAEAVALIGIGHKLRAVILGTSVVGADRFDVLFYSLPFYALIPILSAYTIAVNRERALVVALVLSWLIVAVTVAFRGPAYGFLFGAASFVISVSVLILPVWPGRSATR